MNSIRVAFIAIAVTMLSWTAPQPSRAYVPYATEYTQIANNIELVLQVLEQYKTYLELVKQYQNMIQNTELWKDVFWGRGIDMLEELARAVKKDRVIAYSAKDIAQEFKSVFPGYREYLKIAADDWTPEYIGDLYDDLVEGNRNNIVAALEVTGLQNAEFTAEEMLIENFKLQASTAEGRNRALETGNQIAIEQLRQNQKLRQLLITQLQLQSNYIAYETEKEAAQHAYHQKMQEQLTSRKQNINIRNGKGY